MVHKSLQTAAVIGLNLGADEVALEAFVFTLEVFAFILAHNSLPFLTKARKDLRTSFDGFTKSRSDLPIFATPPFLALLGSTVLVLLNLTLASDI